MFGSLLALLGGGQKKDNRQDRRRENDDRGRERGSRDVLVRGVEVEERDDSGDRRRAFFYDVMFGDMAGKAQTAIEHPLVRSALPVAAVAATAILLPALARQVIEKK